MPEQLSPRHLALLQRGRALVLEDADGSTSRWRVLFTHPFGQRVAWMRLEATATSVPRWISFDELIALVDAGALKPDPDDSFRRRTSTASSRGPIWERRWRIVQAVLGYGEWYWLASGATRSILAAQVAQDLKVPTLAVLRAMTAYYRHGLEPEAVAPFFERCGAPGMTRRRSLKKLGRPRFVPLERLP